MASPVYPFIANIYMTHFEELALGPQCPIPTPWWKRYVDDVICITKKDQLDISFNHRNQLDDHIKYTMESPDNEGSIPFLDTKCTPNFNHTIHTTVYRKPTHNDRYLDWNSNHPISANRSVIYSFYIVESRRCLESKVKEHNTSSTSTIFQHSITHNHAKAGIFQFTIIDKTRKVSREAREAIYIRKNNPALNCSIGKMKIPKTFNQILGMSYSTSADVSTNPNDQNNNNASSSNMAGRAINLHS